MVESFSMRPIGGPSRFREHARIAVEDGALVVSDRDGTEHRFALSGADAPRLLSRHPIDLVRSTLGEAWAVLDAHRMSYFSTDCDLWSPEDFDRLAVAAGLAMGDVLDRPKGTRPDAVDMSAVSMPWWKVVLFVAVPLLVVCLLIVALKAVL